MRNNLLYTVCEFICIFGIGFDAMLCRYARKNPNTNITKLQNIHDCTAVIALLSVIVLLCSLIVK